MTFETVVGQDPAQVGVVSEINTEQVPSFPFPPTGTAVEPDGGGHRLLLIGFDYDSDPLVEVHAEEIVDDLETQRPAGIVDAADVAQHPKAAFWVIAEEFEDARQGLALDPAAELPAANVGRDDRVRQRRRNVFGQGLELFFHRLGQRAKLLVRLIFFCSSRTPYSSASAVGGQPGT